MMYGERSIMSTTVVFACKSNSCRSQMAEGWAHEWVKLEERKISEDSSMNDGDRQLLREFLDGLVIVSVALDEASVSASQADTPQQQLSMSPTSSLITDFDGIARSRQCVTCCGDGDDDEVVCTMSKSNDNKSRKPPKQKAIQAMAKDGIDISSYYAKSYREILPFVMNRRRPSSDVDVSLKSWKMMSSFTHIKRALEDASREMGLAFAGVPKRSSFESEDSNASDDVLEGTTPVDNLIVLCSCPDSLKRQLSDMSKETLDWDIDPPTAASKSAEGDGAYLRVSREIRDKVYAFMNELKRCTLMADS